MTRTRSIIGFIPVIFAWLAVMAVALSFPLFARALLVVTFLVFAPGFAARRFFPDEGKVETLVIAVALSIALAALVTEGLALAHLETALSAMVILASITSVLVLWPSHAGGQSIVAYGEHRGVRR